MIYCTTFTGCWFEVENFSGTTTMETGEHTPTKVHPWTPTNATTTPTITATEKDTGLSTGAAIGISLQGRSQAGGARGAVALGAPTQTPGRLRSIVAGGCAPRPPLGLRPRPRWGSAPNPVQQGVWGRSPQQRSCGEAAPEFGAEPQAPRAPLLATALMVSNRFVGFYYTLKQ